MSRPNRWKAALSTAPDGLPNWTCTTACPELIRTVPEVPWDPDDVEVEDDDEREPRVRRHRPLLRGAAVRAQAGTDRRVQGPRPDLETASGVDGEEARGDSARALEDGRAGIQGCALRIEINLNAAAAEVLTGAAVLAFIAFCWWALLVYR
jgi:hypothetical protein